MAAGWRLGLLCTAVIGTSVTVTSSALAQQAPPPPAPPAPAPATASPAPCLLPATLLPPLHDADEIVDPVPADSNVSFIDPASPWNLVRLRFQAAYNSNRPTRGEYLIPPSGSTYNGFPVPERRIDYQELFAYTEYAFLPQFSVFFEAPARWVNPEFNANHVGLGDLRGGFKVAGIQQPQFTASFQLVATMPTGTPQEGLGIGNATLEPDLLFNWRPIEEIIVESMVGVWLPIDDTNFGSEIMRYGLGVSYADFHFDDLWVAPVVEATGWTTIRGHEQAVFSRRKTVKLSTVGDTIVNGDLGVRAGWGHTADIYVGYSRAFTGDVWYKELWRIEMRWHY
jgi:hypothetical protein